MSETSTDTRLSAFRAQIDALDDKLIDLLKERTAIVKQVGQLKHKTAPGQCPLRPGREAEQVRRVAQAFKESDFAPAAGASLWRTIIAASLKVEGDLRVAVCTGEGCHDLPWLAREYFGAFAPLTRHVSPRRVIGDVLEGKAEIGVLPPLNAEEKLRWWPELIALAAGRDDKPQVFAHLPFVYTARPGRDTPSALAIGMITPEETGEDVTLLALDADENTSMHKLQTSFAQAKREAAWIEVAQPVAGRRQHVVEVKGFISDVTSLKLPEGVDVHLLGAYAAPLALE